MKQAKFLLILLLMLLMSIFIHPVQAELGDEPQTIYLPLVSNEKYVDPWIGPDGGFVVCMVANPFDANIIYAGTWGNGVFKSLDGGLSWKKMSEGLGDLYINSIAIDPQNPNILYAGTYNDEIYKTTTAGVLWYHSSSGIQDYAVVYTIAVDPHNPDIVYIGTRSHDYPVDNLPPPWKGIVYRSMNEGINWTPVLQNVGGSEQQDWAYDIVVNPKDHKMVFVAMHEYGVYRSLDYGDHWQSLNNNGITDQSGRALVINPSWTSSNAIYYGTWHRTGVFKSLDNGSSWDNEYLNAKIYSMDLDPQKPEVIYIADFYNGVLKTTNSGGSWTNMGLAENLMYTVMVNPTRHTQVFAGTAGNGIFRSDNSGSGWVHSQVGLNNANVVGFAVSADIPERYYAMTLRGGFSRSLDSGENWQIFNNGLSDLETTGLTVNPLNQDQIFALTTTGGLFTCYASNCSWSKISTGIPTADLATNQGRIVTPLNELEMEIWKDEFRGEQETPKISTYQTLNDLAFSASNANIAYLATAGSGVYRSTNNASGWSPAGLSGKNINHVVVNPGNSDVVYASQMGSDIVYTSFDHGISWNNSNVPGGVVNDVAVSLFQPGVVYAATNNGIYKRADGGVWELVGLNGFMVTAIDFHPNQFGLIVAGSQGAAYYSKDNGVSWISASGELAATSVRIVRFDPTSSDYAFLGTSTMGVFRLRIK